MNKELNRRNFSRLSLAAFGGLVAGATASGQQPAPKTPAPKTPAVPKTPAAATPAAKKPAAKKEPPMREEEEYNPAAAPTENHDQVRTHPDPEKWKEHCKENPPKEVHVCRGLNTCKGRGRSGQNKCAGQGDCATTANSPHQCSTANACRGQGGCNGKAGANACDSQGDGGVPIQDEYWPKMRAAFEAKMARLKKSVGTPPLSMDEERRLAKEATAKAKADAEAAAAAGETAEAPSAVPKGRAKNPKATAAKSGNTKPAAKTGTKPASGAKKPANQPADGKDLLDDLTGGDKDKKGAKKDDAKKTAPKK